MNLSLSPRVLSTVFLVSLLITATGCSESIVHQKSVVKLNAQAAKLLQSGDIPGAVARLESAQSLMPEDPSILFNLAVTYKENEQLNKSAGAFEDFLKRFEGHEKYNAALKSYGVVLEEIADNETQKTIELNDSEEEMDETNKRLQLKEHLENAIQSYEQSLKAFKLYLKQPIAPKKKKALTQHIEQLSKRLADVQAGKLSQMNEPNPLFVEILEMASE